MNEVIVRRRGCLHGGTRRDPTLPPPESGPTGRDIVGRAWSEEVFIRAVEPKCRDGTYGLTPEQLARYAHIQVVAAPPPPAAQPRRARIDEALLAEERQR